MVPGLHVTMHREISGVRRLLTLRRNNSPPPFGDFAASPAGLRSGVRPPFPRLVPPWI